MQFNGFSKESLDFLDEIAKNNNKPWFEANRYRWEELILKQNKAYVEEMGEHLIALDPFIKASPKVGASLFRIYRDTRFSHDKTPIKTKIAIMFWKGVLHKMKCPCFYMQYKKEEVLIATGIRKFKDELLKNYREYIKVEKNAKELHDILENLKEKNIKLPSMQYKRVPKGFDKDDKYSYLSKYDGMLVYKTFKPNKTFHSKRIINYNFKFYDSTYELFSWLDQFVKSIKE